MIGWVLQWTALVLQLLCVATTTTEVPILDLTISKMDWRYVEENYSSLTVCTGEILLSESYTLQITPDSNEYEWTFIEKNVTCAKFSNEPEGGKQSLPAEQTTYTLSSATEDRIQQTGSVTFTLEGATITCGSVPFLRFNTNAETVDDGICVSLGSLCYVAEEDVESDPICFTGLDESNSEFQVCTEKEAFSALDSYDDSFTADELKYVDGSFSFSFENEELSLAELLILSDKSLWTVVSCDANNICVDDTFAQSAASYDLCGVFVDENDLAVSSGDANFQDTDLRVDTVEPTVDFHFIKMEDNELYLVSGLDENYDPIDEVVDFTLDCSYITPGTICNGFFAANDNIKNVAVSYDDGTNKIIAQVP